MKTKVLLRIYLFLEVGVLVLHAAPIPRIERNKPLGEQATSAQTTEERRRIEGVEELELRETEDHEISSRDQEEDLDYKDLDYTEQNIPQHIQRAEEARQIWSAVQPWRDSNENNQLELLKQAQEAVTFWEAKSSWCRGLALAQSEKSYQDKLNELATVCLKVKEVIEQLFVPLQLDKDIAEQGYSFLEKHEQAIMESYQLPFFYYQTPPSTIQQGGGLFADFCKLRTAAQEYHQKGKRDLWMQLIDRHNDYNRWVVEKNREYAQEKKQKIEDINKSDLELKNYQKRQKYFLLRQYDSFFDYPNKLSRLEKDLDQRIRKFFRSQEAFYVAKLKPRERINYLDGQVRRALFFNEKEIKAFLLERQAERVADYSDQEYDKFYYLSSNLQEVASAYRAAVACEQNALKPIIETAKDYYNQAALAYEESARFLQDSAGDYVSFLCKDKTLFLIGVAYQYAAEQAKEGNSSAANAYSKKAEALKKRLEVRRERLRLAAQGPLAQEALSLRCEREEKLQEILATIYQKIADNFIFEAQGRRNDFEKEAYHQSAEYYERASVANQQGEEVDAQRYFQIGNLWQAAVESAYYCSYKPEVFKELYVELARAYTTQDQQAISELERRLEEIRQEKLARENCSRTDYAY